jgi:hypothetical protein
LTTLFNEWDIGEIAKIVSLQQGMDDKYVWKFHNNGIYRAKSAYRYAMEEIRDDNEEIRVPC